VSSGTGGSAFSWYALLAVAGFAAAGSWTWLAWGAYRRTRRVSQAPFALALALFSTLGLVVLVINPPMRPVIEPTPVRVDQPVLPPEIVGHWRAVSRNPPSLSVADYNFTANGYYTYAHSLVRVEGECKVVQWRSGWGRVTLQETRMTLVPQVSKTGRENSCSGENTEADGTKAEETYFYRLDRRPEGGSLCLEGRDGTLCLSPAPPLK
jgi:hypothetical protein